MGVESERIRNLTELFVARPKNGLRRDEGRGKEMRIHNTDAALKQGTELDHAPYFAQLSDFDHREPIEGGYRPLSFWQVAKNQLRNHKRVDGNVVPLKLLIEFGVSLPKVIDPH